MNQPNVNIIILNWNGCEDTSELLESLSKISYSNYKILVVDNNSSLQDFETLSTKYGSDVQIIRSKENLGFSGGNNFGIEILLKQNADFILLLNNDTTVEPNFLEILVNKFESDNRTGIAAPQINYYDEPDKIWSAGGKISKIRGSGFAYSDKSERVFDKSDISVGFVSGCCMLIKRDVFINTGLFDENYYLYNEDTDFCLRTLKAGYKIYVTPKSKIYHKVNSSTNRELSLLPLYYTTRNRLYFAKKNFPQILFLTAIYLFITMLLKSLVWIIKGRYKNLIVVNNAIKDFYRGKLGKTENNIFCGN